MYFLLDKVDKIKHYFHYLVFFKVLSINLNYFKAAYFLLIIGNCLGYCASPVGVEFNSKANL